MRLGLRSQDCSPRRQRKHRDLQGEGHVETGRLHSKDCRGGRDHQRRKGSSLEPQEGAPPRGHLASDPEHLELPDDPFLWF